MSSVIRSSGSGSKVVGGESRISFLKGLLIVICLHAKPSSQVDSNWIRDASENLITNITATTAAAATTGQLTSFQRRILGTVLNQDQLQQHETSLPTKPSSTDDVHLLCKLLEKHFANNNNNLTTTSTFTGAVLPPSSSSTSSTPPQLTTPKTPLKILITNNTKEALHTTLKPNDPSSIATTTTTPPTTTTTTTAPTTNRYLGNLNELLASSDYERHLLETIVDAEPPRLTVNETDVERLLVHLFGTAWRDRSPTGGTFDDDYSSDTASPKQEGSQLSIHRWPQPAPTHNNNNLQPVPPSKHLHLIYWLLEKRHTDGRLRLLDAHDATELLDQLNHVNIRRQLSAAHLSTPGQLVVPFNRSRWLTNTHEGERPPAPKTIDDSLTTSNGAPSNTLSPQQASSLQLLLDKITQFSFVDNLHLYLALFLFLLILLLLCITVPLICCRFQGARKRPPKRHPQRHRQTSSGTSHERKVEEQGSLSIRGAAKHQRMRQAEILSPEKLVGEESSIWRKLSSSTTTLVQDESRELRTDGFYGIKMAHEQSQAMRPPVSTIGVGSGKEKQLDWCSFEDGAGSVSSKKSGQMKGGVLSEQVSVGQLLELSYAEHQSERHSNTLTKSELVMLKEKLVPIASSGATSELAVVAPATNPSTGSQTTAQVQLGSGGEQEREERLNKANQTSFDVSGDKAWTNDHWPHDSLASHYIDSTDASCAANLAGSNSAQTTSSSASQQQTSCSGKRRAGRQQEQQYQQRFVSDHDNDNYDKDILATEDSYERQPSLRHVEFPAQTKAKLDAIKAELDRLERREQSQRQLFDSRLPSEATYKRFDV